MLSFYICKFYNLTRLKIQSMAMDVDHGTIDVDATQPDPAAGSEATLSDSDSVDWSAVPYDERMKSGFYQRICNEFDKIGSWSLANQAVGEVKWVEHKGNMLLVPADTPDDADTSALEKAEKSFLLVGEVHDLFFGPAGVKPTSGSVRNPCQISLACTDTS